MPTDDRDNKSPARALAAVVLHKDDEQDEPLEVDVDVTVTCDCGASSTERKEIYKERDDVHMMCDACGAMYRVDVSTALTFTASPIKEQESALEGPYVD